MKKKIGTTLVKHENKFYILTSSRELFEINEVGARIFDLCNGVNTPKDISTKLSKVFNSDIDVLLKDVDRYIESLTEMGLVD